MSKLKIRRGPQANLSNIVLDDGEFALTTDNPQRLYVGIGGQKILLANANALGDMLKSIYDTDNDGIVDQAEKVEWSGVINKPGSFTPPVATPNVLGGIKVGSNLSATADGILSGNSNPESFIPKSERFVIANGQTTFNLTKGYYTPGSLAWSIYGFQQPKESITEISGTSFSIPSGLANGTEFEVQYIQTVNLEPYPYHKDEHLPGGADDLGLKPVALSGSYNDLSNRPTSMPANGGTASLLGNAVEVANYNTLAPSAIAQGSITPIKAQSSANSPWPNTTSGFLIQSNSVDSFHILIFRSGGDGWAYRSWYQGTWGAWRIWSTFDGNYNNLSNKPTSLPANGGNADTLNGKTGSYYDIPFVVGSQTVSTHAWVGVASELEALTDGLTIRYWLPTSGNGNNVTLDLTLKGGGTTGAIPCYYGGTSRLTTHFSAGMLIILTYVVNRSINGTLYTGWFAQANYDSNTYDRTAWWNNITAGAPIYDYKLLMQGADGKFYPLTLETGTGTTKTISTQEFLINAPILFYNSTTDIALNGVTSNVYTEIPTTALNYTANQASWVSQKPIYLKGTVNANGNFVLDNTSYTSFMTQDLPTTEDGFVYIMLGYMYATTGLRLMNYHPMYEFRNGKLRPYDGLKDELASKANLASPTFTGTPKAPTPVTSDNSTNIATTAFVKAQGYITSAGSGAKITTALIEPGTYGPGDFWYKEIV